MESLRIASEPSTRAWPESAGVTAIADARKTRRSRECLRAAAHREHGHDGEREAEHATGDPDLPEAGLEHVTCQRPPEHGVEPEPRGLHPGERDPGERADRQQPSRRRDDAHDPAAPRSRAVRDEREHRHAADAQEDQSQPDEPDIASARSTDAEPASASST